MSVMTQLAASIKAAAVDLSQDLDLPLHLTNLYACSVYRFDGQPAVHTFIGAPFTGYAVSKLSDWCETHHKFRPLRSTAKTPVRRLKMVDLIENPAAWDSALANAKHCGDTLVVSALRQLPQWISQQTGVALPPLDHYATSGLVATLSQTLSRLTRGVSA